MIPNDGGAGDGDAKERPGDEGPKAALEAGSLLNGLTQFQTENRSTLFLELL